MEKKYKILPTIDSPVDVRNLNIKELNILGDEIENYIHQVISQIGGHYSSPLGVIDLTLALHYVYNTPKDKLVWDVGHQAYSHKIISGRRKEFSKIRKKISSHKNWKKNFILFTSQHRIRRCS